MDLQLGADVVELGRGRGARFLEAGLAFDVPRQGLLLRAQARDLGFARAQVFPPRALAQELELGVGGEQLGRAQIAVRPLEPVVELRERLGRLDLVAAIDRHLEHAAAELEADHAIVELDHPLQRVVLPRAGAVAPEQDEPPQPCAILYHSSDNISVPAGRQANAAIYVPAMLPARSFRAAADATLAAALRSEYADLPWSKARELCRRGKVHVNGALETDGARRVKQGDAIAVQPSARA